MNIKKTFCFAFFLGLFALKFSFAQNTVNIWYFGDSAGIDFNSGAPVVLTDGSMNTEEGCATICNAAGSLLFYTNGVNVWNRVHQMMPNGLGLQGDISATQSGIIVPQPGNNTIYYIFTVDDLGGANGLRYSVVDMTLAGGLGDVVIKNIPLAGPVSEKITAVNHSNNTDFWVITHGWNSNQFLAYEVTAAGVNTTAVISALGTVHNGSNLNTLGCLKGSHDGSMLALALYNSGIVEIFDFDNSSGLVSNPVTCASPAYIGAYGIEFSPNNNLLYAGVDNNASPIYQFNLLAGTSAAIAASATVVGNTSGGTKAGALQLAPDNKIYVARNNSLFLAVLNNPDNAGLASGFVNNGLYLNNKVSWYGLPNFIQSIFIMPQIILGDSCLGDVTTFSLNSTANLDSVLWNFDDPNSGTANFSTLLSPSHSYTDSGTYQPFIVLFHSGITDTVYTTITIVMPPSFTLGPDRLLCPGASTTLDVCWPGAVYLWENGADSCTRIFSLAGIYWVEVSNRCGAPRDTIQISFYPQTILDIGPDTTICIGDTVWLDGGSGQIQYVWNTHETTQTIAATEEFLYSVLVYDANGCPAFDDAKIHLDPCHQYLFVPNAFTPNGDGLNDLFVPVPGGEKVQIHEFTIYDRWGNLIFLSNGSGWDATYKNKVVQEGAYVWRIMFTDEFGVVTEAKGSVLVVR